MLRTSSKSAANAITTSTFITGHSFPHLLPVSRFPLPTSLLEAPLRKDILHRAVIYERDSLRQGSASTKTRAEVSGSTRKIRPQKGSGQARLGDRTSPMLRGGGRAHGPKPRDFSTELPRKVYYMAIRNAISYLFRGNSLVVVDGRINFPSHKTALAVHFLESHGFIDEKTKTVHGGRTLFIVDDERTGLERGCGNLGHYCEVMRMEEVMVSELLKYNRIIIEKSALEEIEEMTRPINKYKHIVVPAQA